MIGIDRWGKEYASFNKALCENNAVKLPFPDESFDAVTSNYVYPNVSGVEK